MTIAAILLQTLTAEQIQQRQDSIRAGARQMVAYAKEDPHGFWELAKDSMIAFGLKVLAALAIFIVGILLLKWIRTLLNHRFTRRKT